jgi:hypothetical protein
MHQTEEEIQEDPRSVGPTTFFQETISLDGGSARRKAATYTQNERTQTSVTRMWLEPTIPTFEPAKKVHALHRAATVIGSCSLSKS